MSPGVLYISYDGMLEPLGQSQVVAYLEKLAVGRRIHLLSFEKPRDLEDTAALSALSRRLKQNGITWHPQRYHKKPPILSSVWDLGIGAFKCWWIARREKVAIVHARSLLCAAMGLAAAKLNGAKLLFDIRGFWADERVDGGMIRRGGAVYRVLKWLDKRMLRSADEIVTLTDASLPYLRADPAFGCSRAPISVIPTCVDVDLFRPPAGSRSSSPFILGYVGQVGTWYLLDDMVALFAAVRERLPDARLLVVNQHQQAAIHAAAARGRIAKDAYEVVPATREQVPALIGRMTVGMALIKPAFSKISSCPTKLAEYLACGVPCIGNAGVGDVVEVIESRRVGVAIRELSHEAIERAAEQAMALAADQEIAERCRRAAEELFSLSSGAASYERIYRRLETAS